MSRLADHMLIRPTPCERANELNALASSMLNISSGVSFCPIIGVAPSFFHKVALFR